MNVPRYLIRDPFSGPPAFWRMTEINHFNRAVTAALHEPKTVNRLILGAFALLYSGNFHRMNN